ncbi:MAG: phosphatase PAP2 family protein [bacterium]
MSQDRPELAGAAPRRHLSLAMRCFVVASLAFIALGAAQLADRLDPLDRAIDGLVHDGLRHDVGYEATCQSSFNANHTLERPATYCQYSRSTNTAHGSFSCPAQTPRNGTWTQTCFVEESRLPWAGVPSDLGASGAALTLTIATFLLLAMRRAWPSALVVLGVAVIGAYLVAPLKAFFPGSFPSGHTVGGTLGWGLFLVFAARSWRPGPWTGMAPRVALVAWAFIAFAVGFDRVHIGAHPASDVLAGWAFGAALVFLAVLIDDTLRERTARNPAP